MKSRSVLFFYVLVIYIFASFIWWSYLLLQKNEDSFEEKIKLERISYSQHNNLPESAENYLQTPEFNKLKERYLRQKLMIISEGIVFLFLLWIGSMRLYYTLRKEISLARQQNNFLLSITHELKSPLASMKLSLQTILKRVPLEDKFLQLAKNSVDDVDRLSNLVDNILYAARMEDDSFTLHKEMENISDIVRGVLEKIESTNKENLTLRTDIQENVMLETDKMAFASLLQNLVENAIKYSPNLSEIDVILRQNQKTVALEVKDNGIGVPENERNKIFKKFYRIGNEETRSTKGTGIGLFIVRKVTDMHNGNIKVTGNQPRGTVMRVELPTT